jgi:hypothetical protein
MAIAAVGSGGIDTGLGYKGTVTAVPAANQFTIPSLIGKGLGKFDGATAPYSAYVFRDAGGLGAAPQGESQPVTAYNSVTGVFTTAAFTVAVAVGDEVMIIHPSLANALHFSGLATVAGTLAANWQAAEQNLVTIGANGTSFKLHMVLISIANLVGNITIRAYHLVNGVERRIFPVPAATTFTAAASAPAIPIWDTTGAITEAMRITIQSDNAADNGQAVDYEYKLERM